MKTATHQELVNTWLQTNFKDVPCLVFFDPLADGFRPHKLANFFRLDRDIEVALIHADIFCVPSSVEDSVRMLNRLDQETFGFVEVWDGVEVVEHN